MSAMIKECIDRLINKFHKITENEGQLDAKQ